MEFSTYELSKYLRTIRESLGYSIYDVSKLCDISPSYLSLMENGKRRPSPIILKKLSSIYHIDYNDLLIKAGFSELTENHFNENKDLIKKIGGIPLSEIETTPIPILGTVKAGYDYLAQENIIDYIPFKVNGSDKENYYALEVTGDSMEPLFDDGDTVIVHRQDDFENGDNCVVLINGNEATVKKVYKGTNGIELKAVNPYYPPKIFTKEEIRDLPIQVIGVVEKSIRNFKKNKK